MSRKSLVIAQRADYRQQAVHAVIVAEGRLWSNPRFHRPARLTPQEQMFSIYFCHEIRPTTAKAGGAFLNPGRNGVDVFGRHAGPGK